MAMMDYLERRYLAFAPNVFRHLIGVEFRNAPSGIFLWKGVGYLLVSWRSK